MSALQHIVADNASDFCNNLASASIPPLAYMLRMDETDPNGGPNYLRAWREHRGLSQPELANLAETSHQVIGYLERGRTQLSAKWLRKLAPLLGTTPGHLLDHDPSESNSSVLDLWAHIAKRDRARAAEVLKALATGTKD